MKRLLRRTLVLYSKLELQVAKLRTSSGYFIRTMLTIVPNGAVSDTTGDATKNYCRFPKITAFVVYHSLLKEGTTYLPLLYFLHFNWPLLLLLLLWKLIAHL